MSEKNPVVGIELANGKTIKVAVSGRCSDQC